ncbi:phage tail protein [Lederbergia lenta]|uniref:phage tail protein n=1 Tax=Lederbergia lenta TaxID=1467 RepID=UPI00203E488D|nr:hypothetical protein [Lederbergia lenta]MCM3111689.1 hypothetical protein [Lederbergia lenta]
MLYLFNQDDKFINILSKETGLVDMWFKDYQNHLINEPFVFNVKQNSPLIKHIVDENQVAFYDRDNNLRLMRIKALREVTTSNGGFVNYNMQATCEPSFLELYDHFIEDKRYVNKTAQNALDGALQGSRYVGEVTVELGLATDNFYWIDGIGAVFKILVTWGGALKDTITLNDENEIIERKLWIVQRLGADNGLIVEPDFNAEQIERRTLSYVETALWGQGASLETDNGGYTRYITFEDVVWSKSKGDPTDKPKGQKWVGDPQALSQYGYLHNGERKHRFGHFNNQEYETPEELLWATWNELQERKLKEIIHEATINAGDKKVSLGDTVTILDRNYNKPIELQSQITGLEYDPLYPDEDVKIIIGKYIDMNEDPLQKEVDDLKTEVTKPRPTKPITDESFPDIVPGIPVNIVVEGGIEVIQLYWEYDSEVYISHYEVYGSQVADFVPDSQHLLWRGRVSTFTHAVGTDQTWYYYLRAVNTRGTTSSFSQRVSGSTNRVLSEDILFGELIADHFKDGLDIAGKLSQNTIDRINAGPMEAIQYTQKQIEDTERTILEELNSRTGNISNAIADLNTIADGLKNRADATDILLNEHGGKFTSIEQEVNEIEGKMKTTITSVERIDGTVSSHSNTLIAHAELLAAKLSSLEYETDRDGIINRIASNELDIQATAKGLDLRVTKEEYEGLINRKNILPYMELGGLAWTTGAEYTGGTDRIRSPFFKVESSTTYAFSIDGSPYVTSWFEYDENKNFISVQQSSRSTFTTGNSTKFLRVVRQSDTNSNQKFQIEKGSKATNYVPYLSDELEISNRISKTELTLDIHAEGIAAKAEKTDVYTRKQMDDSLGKKLETTVYSKKMGELDLSITGITGRVENTESTVDGINGQLLATKNQLSELNIAVEGIGLSVSDITKDLGETRKQVAAIDLKADKIISTVEDIQIGGVNMIINSNFANDLYGWKLQYGSTATKVSGGAWSIRNTADKYLGIRTPTFSVEEGKTYTVTIEATGLGNTRSLDYVYIMYNTTGISNRGLGTFNLDPQAGKYKRVSATFTATYTTDNADILIARSPITNIPPDYIVNIGIMNVKVEEGNQSTGWSPAPEDINARMTKAESSIEQTARNILLKVDKDGVIASINLSSEGVRINGNKHHITGQTLIDDAVIGTLALANGSVTNLKIGTGAVDTLQVKDGAIARAKIGLLAVDDARIANISVSKLLAGEIDTSKIKIRGGSSIDYTLIDGSYFESRGRFARIWRGASATHDIKLRFENGYLRARNDTLNRSVYFSDYGISTQLSGDNASGTLEFFSKINSSAGRGVTLTSEGVTTIEANGGAIHLDALTTINAKAPIYVPSIVSSTTNGYYGMDGELRLVNKGYADGSSGNPIYRDLRAQFIWAEAISTNAGTNLYLGADSEVRVTSRSGNNGGNPIYRDLRAANLYGSAFVTTSVHAYVGTDDELRVVNKGLSNIYRNVRASKYLSETGTFESSGTNAILYNNNSSGRIFLQTHTDVRATKPNSPSSFVDVVGASFVNNSVAESKQDIEKWEERALDIVEGGTIHKYRLRTEIADGIDRVRYGMVIGVGYNTPNQIINNSGIDQYVMASINWKATQELHSKVNAVEDEVNWLKMDNQYLRQTVEKQNKRIKHLENLLEVA